MQRINACAAEPGKNLTVQEFVTCVYFPNIGTQKRASTVKGYKARWDSQLKARCGHFRLREFGTPQAHKVLAASGGLILDSLGAHCTISARCSLRSFARRFSKDI